MTLTMSSEHASSHRPTNSDASETITFTVDSPSLKHGSTSSVVPTFTWFDNIVFSLETVLQPPAASRTVKVEGHRTLKHDLLTSRHWYQYEKGLLDEHTCVQNVALELDVTPEIIAAIKASHTEREANSSVIHLLKTLEKTSHAPNVYLIGNLAGPDVFPSTGCLDAVFQQKVFSHELGERLPHPGFFTRLLTGPLAKSGAGSQRPFQASRSLFVTSNVDEVIAARAAGLYGILVRSTEECVHRVDTLTSDPVSEGTNFLRRNAGMLHLETNLGMTIYDTFAQLLILSATGDESLVYYERDATEFKWFHGGSGPAALPPFPPCIDCNSVAHSTLPQIPLSERHRMMNRMLDFRDASGVQQAYLSNEKIRLDITGCVNAVAFFNWFGRGQDQAPTESWIRDILASRAFRDGTHYYPSPDVFLFFVSRILIAPGISRESHALLAPLLRDCILERTGNDGDALSLACRIIAGARCGYSNDRDFERLLAFQEDDGSWGAGMIYQFVRYKGLAFHRGVTAALALLAIREWDELRCKTEVKNRSQVSKLSGWRKFKSRFSRRNSLSSQDTGTLSRLWCFRK